MGPMRPLRGQNQSFDPQRGPMTSHLSKFFFLVFYVANMILTRFDTRKPKIGSEAAWQSVRNSKEK